MNQVAHHVDPFRPHHVCKLKKSLYGLRDSGFNWNQKLTTELIDMRTLRFKMFLEFNEDYPTMFSVL